MIVKKSRRGALKIVRDFTRAKVGSGIVVCSRRAHDCMLRDGCVGLK